MIEIWVDLEEVVEAVEVAELPVGVVDAAGSMAAAARVHPKEDMAEAVKKMSMIPSNKCGLVIGKGGETIKTINFSTGAHCEVNKSAPQDAREKNFIIRGSPDAVEQAKAMIMDISKI